MASPLEHLAAWARSLGNRRQPYRLVILGIDYGCHQWYQALTAGGQFNTVAFIDDEPWNHRTLIGRAPVHYPSELVALVRKHRAIAVVQVKGAVTPKIDDSVRRELEGLKVPLLQLPASLPADPPGFLTTAMNRHARLRAGTP